MDIRIEKTTAPRQKPQQDNLGFGTHFSDHMFILDYTEGKGWHDARIVPYGALPYEPSMMTFHYGQSIFEGLKAYRTKADDIVMFRPDQNMKRLNESCDRLCIPRVDEAFCLEAMRKLVALDREWVPSEPGTSLYVRPFVIATDPFLGVRPSNTYQFIIITGPVGALLQGRAQPRENLGGVGIRARRHGRAWSGQGCRQLRGLPQGTGGGQAERLHPGAVA